MENSKICRFRNSNIYKLENRRIGRFGNFANYSVRIFKDEEIQNCKFPALGLLRSSTPHPNSNNFNVTFQRTERSIRKFLTNVKPRFLGFRKTTLLNHIWKHVTKTSENRVAGSKNTTVEDILTSKRGGALIDWAVISQHCNLFGVVFPSIRRPSRSGVYSADQASEKKKKRGQGIRRNKEREKKEKERVKKWLTGEWSYAPPLPGGPRDSSPGASVPWRAQHPASSSFSILLLLLRHVSFSDRRFLESLPVHGIILL